MNFESIFFLIILYGLILFAIIVWKRTKRAVEFLREQGVELDFYYKNLVGISQSKQKLFLNVAMPLLLDTSQVRRIEKNSIFETKSNAWGMQFHKEKNCTLVVHANDLAHPSHIIGFDTPKDMELWYSRLGTFCNLT